jgi:hypothetical protein
MTAALMAITVQAAKTQLALKIDEQQYYRQFEPCVRTDTDDDDTIDLYRAVGVREYESIKATHMFLPGGNSLEARQFVFTEGEALKYAYTDVTKVAIVKVTVPSKTIARYHYTKDTDVSIFTNGVLTVYEEDLAFFNSTIINIEFVY